jgi:hypothetical protein
VQPELGIDDRVARKPLQLTIDRISDRIIRKLIKTKVMKQIVGLREEEDGRSDHHLKERKRCSGQQESRKHWSPCDTWKTLTV